MACHLTPPAGRSVRVSVDEPLRAASPSHWAGDVGAAIAHASRAIELNANFALGHFYLGIGLSLDGRHEEALEAIETGWRLSPRDPRASTWLANKARALYHLGRYDEAIETALAARRIRPHAYGSLVLAASYAQLGRDEEARSALADIRALPGGNASMMRWYLDRSPTHPPVSIWPTACARRAFPSNDG